MAKVTKTTVEDAALADTTNTADLYAAFSPEELAEMLANTGQAGDIRTDKVPVLKTNYSDLEDKDGNSIKKGHFVYNQNSKEFEDGDDIKAEYIGVDLGKSPLVTILAYRQQYAYYSDDPKQRCSSQIFGTGEKPVGNNLKYECRAKTCPRRADGVDRKEKCVCQYVVMGLVKIDEETKPFMMYVKGKSFMPFNDFIKASGNTPLFFAPTRLSNKMEKQGAVTYFVSSFELLTDSMYPAIEARSYMSAAKSAIGTLEEFKKSQFQKAAAAQIVDKSAGSKAVTYQQDISDDDDIVFD